MGRNHLSVCPSPNLAEDVAFFIANHIQSNVREWEGGLCRLVTTICGSARLD